MDDEVQAASDTLRRHRAGEEMPATELKAALQVMEAWWRREVTRMTRKEREV
ncbi:hypothetical protein GCM10009765_72030 [Fodinicola feengrottensis]|uniref:Uncharacterized protein n=1 Tax=Fodinicola feengrottensis TaxID=435914 RepID=A0ABN2IVE1_9ACTN